MEAIAEILEYMSVFVRDKNEWARLMFRETQGEKYLCADVHISSSYGNWSFWWGGIGDPSTEAFLADLDSCYMGSKMLGGSFYVRDDEQTQKNIRKHILESRRDGSMDANESRQEFDLLKEYVSGDIDFEEYCRQSCMCEPWEYGSRKADPAWSCFWDRLWVPGIQPKLREMASAKAKTTQTA